MSTQNLNAPDDTDVDTNTQPRNWTWLKVLGIILGTTAGVCLLWFFFLWQHIGPTPGTCGGSGTPCAAATTPPPAPVPVVVVAPPAPPLPSPPPAIACNVCEATALASVPTVDQGPSVLAEARSACLDAGCR